jgi:SAM-dependent MidA family methyltransferase
MRVWLDSLPDQIEGVVLGNEVLDAMPVRVWSRRDGVWREQGVCRGAQGFVWQPCGNEAGGTTIPEVLLRMPGSHDIQTETHEAAEAFISSIAERLKRGLILLFDYGFPAAEYYHPQREQGTLMCHYRQHAHDDPFFLPGLQDITAHVNFSGVAQHATAHGLEVAGYTSQARFLMNAGLMDLLMELDPHDASTFLPASNAAQRLLSEAEMGELFKVIALAHNIESGELSGFERGDRSHRLLDTPD